MAKKKYEKPEILSEEDILKEAEDELLEPEAEPKTVTEKSTTVLFKFNKNVKYGAICVVKNETIEINREDAVSFGNSKHGEIIEAGG